MKIVKYLITVPVDQRDLPPIRYFNNYSVPTISIFSPVFY